MLKCLMAQRAPLMYVRCAQGAFTVCLSNCETLYVASLEACVWIVLDVQSNTV